MQNDIKELEIENFKSIKNIKFNPKRVNVIIGKPNVGKSNILEAMSLMTESFNYNVGRSNFFGEENVIRHTDMASLFYDFQLENKINISTDKFSADIFNDDSDFIYVAIDKYWQNLVNKISNGLNFANGGWKASIFFHTIDALRGKRVIEGINYDHTNFLLPFVGVYNKSGKAENISYIDKATSPVKRYIYKELDEFDGGFKNYLIPPFGTNLYSILEKKRDLLDEFASYIEEQGLEFVLDKGDKRFIIQKKQGRYVTQFPYLSIADTLKHIIFYLAAIESNKDSVLLFEEPEVHSYPPYIKMLADRIILSDENQFFITTHSPYMLNSFINDLKDEELNVILAYYEDYQTKIKILSSEELSEIQEWHMDVFFNLDRFIGDLQEK